MAGFAGPVGVQRQITANGHAGPWAWGCGQARRVLLNLLEFGEASSRSAVNRDAGTSETCAGEREHQRLCYLTPPSFSTGNYVRKFTWLNYSR